MAAIAGFLLGGVIADAAEPIFAFIGGGSAAGIALMCAWEWQAKAEPRWDHATAMGAIGGALVGAGVMIVDVAVGSG